MKKVPMQIVQAVEDARDVVQVVNKRDIQKETILYAHIS
jgi:hypothetical protein